MSTSMACHALMQKRHLTKIIMFLLIKLY